MFGVNTKKRLIKDLTDPCDPPQVFLGMVVISQGFEVDVLFPNSCLLGQDPLGTSLGRPARDSLRRNPGYLADGLAGKPVDLHRGEQKV